MTRGTAGAWPLIGRGSELEAVAAAIGRPDVSGVVLAGLAGVGKTRLGTECLAIAEKAGFTTARAIATSAVASIPLGALAPLLPDDPRPQARADALQRATRALSQRNHDAPFMLLVDDAHLLDPASAAVVHQLALAREVFIVVTVRVGEDTPDTVASLWKDDLAIRVDVSPLTQDDVGELVRRVLGGEVDGATRSQLFRLSEGNPLFLRELVVGALDAGLLTNRDGVWSLWTQVVSSPRLIELVEARVAGLADGPRRALEVVAFGEPLQLDLLLAIADADDVEALERLNLVSVSDDATLVAVRLAHPLHGEILRAHMPKLRAMAVQRRLAETFAADTAPRAEDALRVAVWSLEGGADVAPDLLLAAARQAHIAHDAALAERLARAAHASSGGPAATQLLGEVLGDVGRHDEAVEALRAGLAEASSADDLALIAMTLTDSLYWGLGREGDARAVLDEAEERLATSDWVGEIQGLRASLDLLGGRPHAALAVVEPLLTSAHPRTAVQAGTVAAPALALIGKCERSMDIADATYAKHSVVGEMAIMSAVETHLVSRTLAMIEAGLIADATALARAGYDGAIAVGARDGQAWFALMLGRAQWLSQPGIAASAFREGASMFRELGLDPYRAWCLGGAALCHAVRGEADEASSLMDALDDLPARAPTMMHSDVLRARGWTAVAHDDLGAGRRYFRDAAEVARERRMAPLEVAALHDLARLGDPEQLERLTDAAATVDGSLAVARAAHAAAVASNDADALGQACETFAEIGAAALSAEAAAQASAAHQRDGNARGAARWAQRCTALVADAGGLSTPAVAAIGSAADLTKRELEVARLAAAGRSNQEIADELFVSVRTVGNHLQRAYEKLGVGRREDLPGALKAPGQFGS